MKFYLNRQPVTGPWGGGNKFVTQLAKMLTGMGHTVTFQLEPADFYVCFDPRPDSFGMHGMHIVQHAKQWGGKLVVRVGDCGTHGKPNLTQMWAKMLEACDISVFPSRWAKTYMEDYMHRVLDDHKSVVIHNGVAPEFEGHIIPQRRAPQRREPIGIADDPWKIVTHHWSDNPKKGFANYCALQDSLTPGEMFTYIGRAPARSSEKFKNHIKPIHGQALVDALADSHIYFTASQEEAGANHVLEAMALGIPVVYSTRGGSIPEYVGELGIPFDDDPIEEDDDDEAIAGGAFGEAIQQLMANYDIYVKRFRNRHVRTAYEAVNDFVHEVGVS